MNEVDHLLAEHAPWASRDLTWRLTPLESFLWLDDRPEFPKDSPVNGTSTSVALLLSDS